MVVLSAACRQQSVGGSATPPTQNQPAPAGTSAQPVATAGQQGSSSVPDVEPGPVQAMDKMGAYLRTLKAFQVIATTSRDDVLDDGEKIESAGTVDMLVKRPDGLRAVISSDRQDRTYFYDGKAFTLWAPRVNYYATASAPATLGELGDRLNDRYGLELPLADLFYWGERKTAGEFKSATDIGPSQVEGVSCEHYAYRGQDVDFQVWIQLGEYPLPRKIVITTLSDDARPQYRSVLNWNLAPAFNDAAFTFDPPSGARKIVFAESRPSGPTQ
jgi:hypothetical protein